MKEQVNQIMATLEADEELLIGIKDWFSQKGLTCYHDGKEWHMLTRGGKEIKDGYSLSTVLAGTLNLIMAWEREGHDWNE